jgi:hypothetical protein
MLFATSTGEALKNQRQVHVNGHDYTLSEYVGAMPLRGEYKAGNETNDNGLPQGFLVHQPPNSVTPPHFHETNQFQVFVGGSGWMGKRAATPLTVQYVNAHTPYGPIEAGDKGVRYFTLRQCWDPGAKYMPASRDRLVRGNQRTRLAGNIPVSSDDERMARCDATNDEILAPEADGLAAHIFRVGPEQDIDLPDPALGGGQYLIVASGSVLHGDDELDRWSTFYVTPDERAPELSAGQSGVDLLVLQFPRAISQSPTSVA